MTSDNEKIGTKAATGPQFTDRELQLLGWAMQSLKSGPPDIDYDKLATFAGMSNPRSASNAWAKIKVKLMTPLDGAAPATPKKAGGGAKKKTPAKSNVDEDGESSPQKPSRKRAAKKQDVDGDASPKKRGRGKKAPSPEVNIKPEIEDSQESSPASSPLSELVEGNDDDEV